MPVSSQPFTKIKARAIRPAALLLAGALCWATMARAEEPQGGVVCLTRTSDAAETMGREVFGQNDISLNADETYTLTFWARSPEGLSLKVSAKASQPPWNAVGTPQKVDLTAEWQKCEVMLEPKGAVPGHTRLYFGFAEPAPGQIQLADIRLRNATTDDAKSENLMANGRFEEGLKTWYSEGVKPDQFQVTVQAPAEASGATK